jgi:hypothetical protein
MFGLSGAVPVVTAQLGFSSSVACSASTNLKNLGNFGLFRPDSL